MPIFASAHLLQVHNVFVILFIHLAAFHVVWVIAVIWIKLVVIINEPVSVQEKLLPSLVWPSKEHRQHARSGP
jgi:hypothetical protein